MCKHYWIFESPHGKTSEGKCKYCGATCKGINSMPDIEADLVYRENYFVYRPWMFPNSVDRILTSAVSRLVDY